MHYVKIVAIFACSALIADLASDIQVARSPDLSESSEQVFSTEDTLLATVSRPRQYRRPSTNRGGTVLI